LLKVFVITTVQFKLLILFPKYTFYYFENLPHLCFSLTLLAF